MLKNSPRQPAAPLDPPINVGCIIVAAGISQRMDGIDKIFAPLAGKPLIAHTIEVFQKSSAIQQIVLALNKNNLAQGQKLLNEFRWSKVTRLYIGGECRQDSVARGLPFLLDCPWVIIHDGSRPCLSSDLIEKGLICARETGAAIAAVPVTETIKMVNSNFNIKETPDRKSLWVAQTPQIFRRDIITAAHKQAASYHGESTDDAALVEILGYEVKIYHGSYDNIKITTVRDLALAEIILNKEKKAQLPIPSPESNAYRNRI